MASKYRNVPVTNTSKRQKDHSRNFRLEKEYPEYESSFRIIDKLMHRDGSPKEDTDDDLHDIHAAERRRFRYKYLNSAILER